VTLVDRQPQWISVARRNVLESRVEAPVIEADVRDLAGDWDLAVSNPPWFSPDEPIPPDPWKAASRAMLHGRVADFVAAGLRVAPRVCVVTRIERMAELRSERGHLARVARFGDKLVLAELRRGEGSCVEEAVDVAAAYARWPRVALVPGG
jgi:tRNA1(Val) A37 N6-methylase TrmN6